MSCVVKHAKHLVEINYIKIHIVTFHILFVG